MTFLPSPEELRAIALRIGSHARTVRARADTLQSALATADWSGLAADAFEAEARTAIGGLRSSAGRLDDAADALRRHAEAVAEMLAVLARLEHDGAGLLGDIVSSAIDPNPAHILGHVESIAGDAGHVAGDVASGIGHFLGIG